MTRGKINILVVDDDISHCTILQALLRGWGYEVALAYSGRAALEQVRERVFDLVLCDVRMAEMDGIATLKEIKALNPAIPVLIMTAFSSVETAVEALKTGALDYLIKPLDFDRLQETPKGAGAYAGNGRRTAIGVGCAVWHDWQQSGDAAIAQRNCDGSALGRHGAYPWRFRDRERAGRPGATRQ